MANAITIHLSMPVIVKRLGHLNNQDFLILIIKKNNVG